MSFRFSILVLEDDEEWFDIIKDRLGDEYDFAHAKGLEEAAQWLRAKNFHLAIVDLNLKDYEDESDRSGYLLIEDLRSQEILRDMSIVVVSRYDDPNELRTAFKGFRVHDFVSKAQFDELPFKRIVDEAIAASYDNMGQGVTAQE